MRVQQLAELHNSRSKSIQLAHTIAGKIISGEAPPSANLQEVPDGDQITPAAETDGHELTMDDFPEYPWIQQTPRHTSLVFSSIRLPEVIGQPLHISKEGWDTHWRYPPDWLAPLYWYFSKMEFPTDTLSERTVGITWLELMFDFVCSTFIIPAPIDSPGERDVFRLFDHFASAARRLFTLCGKHIKHFVELERRMPVLGTLDLPDAMGFFPRPLLRQPRFVASNMLRLTRSNLCNKLLVKLGNADFQFPTRPIWEPDRAQLLRQRLRGKQKPPDDWVHYSPSSTASVMPAGILMPNQRGPRNAPTASQLAAGSWTDVELTSINSFPQAGGYRVRERKRLAHNRHAVDNSWHVITQMAVDDKDITCQNCDFTTVIGQLAFWLKPGTQRECLGNAAPRTKLLEVRKRNLIIDIHNETCDAVKKHTIPRLTHESGRLECGRCHEWVPLTQHGFQDFRK